MKQFKQKHWFFGTLLMMTFLFSATFVSFAGQNIGVIDSIHGEAVNGWAWNSADPAAAVNVRVVVTSQVTGKTVAEANTTASTHREDLALKGTGTGNYGFSVSIPWDTLEDGSYLVSAYNENGQKLSGSKVHSVGTMEATAATEAGNLRSLGVFRTTGYCPCYRCSEGWGRNTSTGAIAAANHTIAVDPRVIPYGSKVMINGVIYTAEDRGGAVKGNHIDIFFNTHAETVAQGLGNAEVFLVQ